MRKRKTKEFSKDFLTPMSIEEIRAKVNAAVPGAIYNVMIIDGSPLTLKEGRVLYVTETFYVRLKASYERYKEVAFKRYINKAWTPEHVLKARQIFESLKHKEFIANTAIRELEKKEKLVAAGIAIPKPEESKVEEKTKSGKPKVKPIEDAECPSIILWPNGTQQLRCYTAFRNNIKSIKGGFEYFEENVVIRFFVKNSDGTIFEIAPKEDDEKSSKAMDEARATARAIAKKKGSGNKTLCPWPNVCNILKIGQK